jgi:hypothetical protein
MLHHPDGESVRVAWLAPASLRGLGGFVTLCLLLASGRVGSSDTGAQLDAAILLVRSGSLAAPRPFGTDPALWVPARRSIGYYQCHDLASQLVLVPAALLDSRADPLDPSRPALRCRVAAGLTYSLMGAVTLWLLYHVLLVAYSARQALVATLILAMCTSFAAYTKSAWDVSGAAMGVAGLMAVLARASARGSLRAASVLGIAAWFAIACSFRFSLTPFLAVAMSLLAWRMRSSWPRELTVIAAALAVGLLVPQMSFNLVRTGSPLVPATATAQFAASNSLTGNALIGLYGLILSPNRGLLWFGPVYVLSLLPFSYRAMAASLRVIVAPLLVASGLYVLTISQMRNWGAFGWGPRYLVPIMPIAFVPAAAGLLALGVRRKWGAAIVAAAIGLLVNLAAVLTNWQLVLAKSSAARDPLTPYPAAVVECWRAVFRPDLRQVDREVVFPDLLLARLARNPQTGATTQRSRN